MKDSLSYKLIDYIRGETDKLVTKVEFQPVRAIAYGIAGTILLAVLYSILSFFIKK